MKRAVGRPLRGAESSAELQELRRGAIQALREEPSKAVSLVVADYKRMVVGPSSFCEVLGNPPRPARALQTPGALPRTSCRTGCLEAVVVAVTPSSPSLWSFPGLWRVPGVALMLIR